MSFLLDENLSPRLVPRLSSLFGDLVHVRDVGLNHASDQAIWEWAAKNLHTIVTTDADFAAMSLQAGWPPKVIHLEECDFPFQIIEKLLRQNAVRIAEFGKDPNQALLALRFTPGGVLR